jgi:formate dehydrogenase subunit gamma
MEQRMNNQNNSSQKIMRFRKSERNIHWAIAIPFMICYATALVLIIVYNPDPTRPYRQVVSWTHRISGVCLFVFPMLAAIKNRNEIRVYFQNIKEVWTWRFADIKWLCLIGMAAISKKITLPDQGKYNAGEKFSFMCLLTTYPLYILTGILIWVTNGILLSWLIHFGMALIATPFIAGHLYMAMINPSSRAALSGMFSGFVDREFVKHHHALWYRKNFEYTLATNESTESQPIDAGLRDGQEIESFEKPVSSS